MNPEILFPGSPAMAHFELLDRLRHWLTSPYGCPTDLRHLLISSCAWG